MHATIDPVRPHISVRRSHLHKRPQWKQALLGTEFSNRAVHCTDQPVEGMNSSLVCLKGFPRWQHTKRQNPEVAYKSLRKHKPPEREESFQCTPMPHTEPDGLANRCLCWLSKRIASYL